ncbi:hypothetical protein [Larkinella humicola]|uniref:Uncharacterized protein n=1 Tax=Larkinella humicola TaxID=2607654 RepID=A0A5N1JGA2_9BACT|nr:hypothetical protein [Larkinella humicola]KAA9354072.1 hypothetical protein F0P93_15790 [Larkinella humicola]
MKKPVLFWLAATFCVAANAQDLMTGPLSGVSTQLKPVKTGNAQFIQKIEASQPNYRATFSVTKTSDKGKGDENTYFLNLSDLDVSTVTYKVERDVIAVLADTKQHRKFVRYSENGELKNLTDRVKLYADNPDIAKALVESLKKVILAAEKAYKPARTPDTLDELRQWLKANIGNEAIGSDKYEQALTFDFDNPLRAVFRRSEVGGKGSASSETFSFNLGDLGLEGLQIETKGKRFELSLVVQQKQKLMGYAKDGKLDNVVQTFEIISGDADKIRDVAAAWRKLIPLAVKQLESKKPVFAAMPAAQKYLESSIQPAKTNDRTIEQSLKPDCICTYTRRETYNKNNTEEVYEFNLADLAEKGAKLGVDKELYTIDLKTRDNRRFIGYTKNGVRQNYVSEIELASDNLENVRYMSQAFEKAVQACAQSRKSPVPTAGQQARLDWISQQLPKESAEKDPVTYTLTAENGTCDLKLTVAQGGRKVSELVYDLALKDLNADATSFDVDGKTVYVSLVTKGKEKLVKTFKDGKPSDYVHTVKIQLGDIEKGRYVAEAFRQLIRNCVSN